MAFGGSDGSYSASLHGRCVFDWDVQFMFLNIRFVLLLELACSGHGSFTTLVLVPLSFRCQIIGTLEDRRFGTEGLCCHRMVEGPVHKYIMITFGFLFGVNDRQVNSRPNPEICLYF